MVFFLFCMLIENSCGPALQSWFGIVIRNELTSEIVHELNVVSVSICSYPMWKNKNVNL